MRKNVFGRKFKRDKNERKALFKGLLSALVIHGRIETTEQKAKAIKADADKLITKARKGGPHAQKLLERDLLAPAVSKLISDVAPRFEGRNGGYTRIIRLGKRFSDNASTAVIEWVEGEKVIVAKIEKSVKTPKPIKVAKNVKKASAKKPVAKTKSNLAKKTQKSARKAVK